MSTMLGSENLSDKLSRASRNGPQPRQEPVREVRLQRASQQQLQVPQRQMSFQHARTPQVPLQQASQQTPRLSIMNEPRNGQDLMQIPERYIAAIMAHESGQLLTPDVISGLSMLDHTLRQEMPIDDVENRIMRIQYLIRNRTLTRDKISPDQSEPYNRTVYNIRQVGERHGYYTSKERRCSSEWAVEGWNISLSFWTCSANASDFGFRQFFTIVSCAVTNAIWNVINKIDWSDVPQIKQQNVKIVVYVLESDIPSVGQIHQQAIWKKQYNAVDSTWHHDIMLILKYNHAMNGQSISGFNLLEQLHKNKRAPTPKQIIATSDMSSKRATGYNPSSDLDDNIGVYPQFLSDLEMLKEYYRRVTIHELGHIFHALLHPIQFALLNPVIIEKDAIGAYMYKTEDSASFILNESILLDGKQIEKRFLTYALNNEREAIAELFSAMVLGAQISPLLYGWYLSHGGPKFKNPPLITSPDVPPNPPPNTPLNTPR